MSGNAAKKEELGRVFGARKERLIEQEGEKTVLGGGSATAM